MRERRPYKIARSAFDAFLKPLERLRQASASVESRTVISRTSLIIGTSMLFAMSGTAFAAVPASVKVGTKTYYKVTAGTTENTGKKVCAAVGKTCIGYTNLGSNTVCKAFHRNAKSLVSVNGSKAGFYCDGAPQKGLACEKFKNTCEVCPACNVNADCNTDISGQFREMYVECGGAIRSSASSKKSSAASRKSSAPAQASFGPYPGSIACDFYQKNKKVVTCAAYKAADNFCVIAMQSRFAKAAECNDSGRIICTKPCVTNPKEVMIKGCAYDGERRRGYQAPPLNFCNRGLTSSAFSVPKVTSSGSAKKKAGEICKHGGDCATGICLGTGRPYGSDLQQCSCSQKGLDYSCNK